ncbi:MAG: hypothetical protein AAGI11_12610 [Pseudomonadota bacterium]
MQPVDEAGEMGVFFAGIEAGAVVDGQPEEGRVKGAVFLPINPACSMFGVFRLGQVNAQTVGGFGLRDQHAIHQFLRQGRLLHLKRMA